MWFYSLLSAFCEVGKTIAGIPFTDGDAAAAVQSLSCVWLFSTPWTAAHQASLSFTISQSLLVIMSIESVMPSNHLILSHPLLLPSIFPTIRVFSNESDLHIKCQIIGASASASVLPMNIQGWFPLALTGLNSLQYKSLKSLLHHGLKAWILQRSAFFMVQLSHPYMTTGNAEARLHRASEWCSQDENSGSRFQFNSLVLCLFVLNSSYSLFFLLPIPPQWKVAWGNKNDNRCQSRELSFKIQLSMTTLLPKVYLH